MSDSIPKRRRLVRWLVVLSACSLVAVAVVSLVGRKATAAETKVDAEAQKVIDRFGEYYASANGFRVTVDIDLSVERQGTPQNIKFKQRLAAQRPNKFSYLYEGPAGGATIVSDGKDLSVYLKGFSRYATEAAPESLEAMFANPIVMGVLSMGNATPVTAAILSGDPAKKLLETADSVEYGGTEEVDGVKCHLLKATGEQMDWQLWIDAGKQPLVRRFLPDLAKVMEAAAKAQGGQSPLAGLKITNIVNYNDWEIDPEFAADAFVFHVPEGATKAGSLMEIVSGAMRSRGRPAPHALLGKPAPQIDLELLDGGQFDLASYKGKNVVILDFWATWCGPCVQAMPKIEKVAQQYKDQGVLLFAVNIQETPEAIQSFLDETKLNVAVALDTEATAARAYLANAIPQTVLVGKDGTVQVVKIGLLPDLEASLAKDLEDLLAGKDLAAEALAEAKKPAGQPPSDAPKAKKAKKPQSRK